MHYGAIAPFPEGVSKLRLIRLRAYLPSYPLIKGGNGSNK